MKERKFKTFICQNDPGVNYIFYIQEDNQGYLWMTTEAGLVRIDPSGNILRNYKIFTKSDGLPFEKFYTYSFYKNRSGKLFIGSKVEYGNGFISFYPNNLLVNNHVPPIVLTGFKIHNQQTQLDSNITVKKYIKLHYNENFFNIEFAALDYKDPSKNQYTYMLEGLDKDWIYSGNVNFANYTDIRPGKYKFRVKGSNNDGIWNEEGASVMISILPPPWKTWWAYTIYLMFLAGLFFTWRRNDLKHHRLKQALEIEHVEAEKLKELDSIKSRFFANISHEFRTPLTLILGPLQKIRSKISDRETEHDLNMMQRNAHRLQNLINQLLDLSKLESGKMKLQASKMDLIPMAKGYVQSFESLARQKGIDLIFTSEADSLPIYINQEKFEKILFNLLSNAFKFTPDGGRVEVKVCSCQFADDRTSQVTSHKSQVDSLLITISDTGPGIPPEKLPHIFDRFYQADDSYTKDGKGTGIGLALTKELVELHHGRIEAESEVGIGTTFRVYLPLGSDHLKSDEIETSRHSTVSSRQSTIDKPYSPYIPYTPYNPVRTEDEKMDTPLILIVEDNADLRLYIRGYLDPTYHIIEAEDGQQGLESAIANVPDLVISDVMMPKMDGFELTQKLKTDERTSHIPVILLTAKAGMENKLEGLETGADDFITKPFEPQELLIRIKNLIVQRKKLSKQLLRKTEGENLFPFLQISDSSLSEMDKKYLKRAIQVVGNHLSDQNLDVNIFCEEMVLSQMQVYRKFKALFNYSTNEFIRMVRLHKAAEMLVKKTGNIGEIAYDVGFSNPSYFSKCFKKQFGMHPSEYSKTHQ